jgi:hypothetical protein
MREKLTGGRGARKARNLTGLSAQSWVLEVLCWCL